MTVKMYPSRNDVKITVLRKYFHQDLIEKYTETGDWGPCPKLNEGQVFIVPEESCWEMPPGFCSWAWNDIAHRVWGMARGGPNVYVTCCSDGYRPVILLLEKMAAKK